MEQIDSSVFAYGPALLHDLPHKLCVHRQQCQYGYRSPSLLIFALHIGVLIRISSKLQLLPTTTLGQPRRETIRCFNGAASAHTNLFRRCGPSYRLNPEQLRRVYHRSPFGLSHRDLFNQAPGQCVRWSTGSRVFPTNHRPEHHPAG